MAKQSIIKFLNRGSVSAIGVLLLSQLIFLIFETTGWMPKYREIDGTFLGRIIETPIFTNWFTFYETDVFNFLTFIFVIQALVAIVIGVFKWSKEKAI